MSVAWQRFRLTQICVDAGLSESEQYFLQAVIRLADTSGVLTDNALSIRTASFTVPWASSLTTAYKEGQPKWKYVKRALTAALAACDRLQPAELAIPTALGWEKAITSLLASAEKGPKPLFTVSAMEVEAHQSEISALVLTAKTKPPTVLSMLDLLAAEVALGLISHACDTDKLIIQIKQLRPKGSKFREELIRLLSGRPMPFNVIVPVGGARTLESIEELNPSANIRQVSLNRRGAFVGLGWGAAASKAREFVEDFERTLNHPNVPAQFRQQRVMLSLRVNACDIRAAAVIARRTVAEALDQYVAGHPFVHFEIDDIMAVSFSGKSHLDLVSLRPPIEKAVQPLAIPWPDALRQAMRVSHLLRDSTAPMSRVAIAWVMIESSGLRPDDITNIAKMLALETLRQATFMPYRFLVQDAMDRELVRYYKRRSTVCHGMAQRKWNQAQGPRVPESAASQLLWDSQHFALLAKMYYLLAQKADQSCLDKRAALARLDSKINPTVDVSIGHRAYLPSLKVWLSLLDANWESSSADGATALRYLLNEAGISTTTSVQALTQAARSGPTAGRKLAETHGWLVDVLNSFYAARNMNLHRGIFNSEVDITLGELAVLVSDALFEIWSTWYSNGNGLEVTEIAQTIAGRYDWILKSLNSTGSMTEIDIDRLTAPDWSP